MKRYILIFAGLCTMALVALTQTSCKDLLEQKPQGEWTKGGEGGSPYESAVFAIYNLSRSYNITAGIPAFAIHYMRSEDSEKGSTSDDGSGVAGMYDDFNYNASEGTIKAYWNHNYSIIAAANTILDDLTEQETKAPLSESELINRGEASFFRGWCYFNLVRAFGEVPKVDFKVTDASQSNVPKSSVDVIYALIDSDLTLAESLLPTSWSPAFIGRLTWGAARSMHAKAYLQRGDWGNAYSAASAVVSSGIYDLTTPYYTIFRETGENSKESVFELQCTASADKPASLDVGSQFCEVQGVRGSGDWDLGWGWNCPTPNLAAAFEAGDPRKDETLLYFYKAGEDPSTIPANQPWGEKPEAGGSVMNFYYSKKAYTNPSLRTQFTKKGFWYNIRIIRYSDVVLMAAEAANEMGGKSQEVIDLLESVRARARAGANVLPKVTTTDQALMRIALKHERRVEFGHEPDRFYDLVRWGDDVTVLHDAGKTAYQTKHRLLPIPQDVIDASNGVLVQNPDYL